MTEQIISREGYNKLKEELENLSTVKRREIADRIEAAKELGDLSENAEYSDAKEAQAFNEGRIAEIANLLKNLKVVESTDKSIVGMGSKVEVESDGRTREFEIVSFNEADPASGKISNESPLGEAFLEKRAGDSVKVNTPKGEVIYKIKKVN
jgi:transcription elongation factor GreA